MQFTQSRYQDAFSRTYQALCYLGYFLIFDLFAYFYTQDINFTKHLTLTALFILIPTIYVQLKYKAGPRSLKITEDLLLFKNREVETDITPQSFEGYKVTKLPPYKVVLKDKVYGTTEFSYYAFSKSQRQQIFSCLDNFSN